MNEWIDILLIGQISLSHVDVMAASLNEINEWMRDWMNELVALIDCDSLTNSRFPEEFSMLDWVLVSHKKKIQWPVIYITKSLSHLIIFNYNPLQVHQKVFLKWREKKKNHLINYCFRIHYLSENVFVFEIKLITV